MERHTTAFVLCLAALAAGVYDTLPSIRIPRIPVVPPVPPIVRPFFPPAPSPISPAVPTAATATAASLFSPTALPPLDSPVPQVQAEPTVAVADAGAQAPVYMDELTGISVTKPTIIQISIPGCQPCIDFMNNEKQRYINVGWDVQEVKNPAIVMPSYPSYRIINRDKQHTHVGKLTPKVFNALLRGRPLTNSSQVTTSNVAAVSYYPVVDDVGYTGADYKINGREWTAASLRAHLYTHSNHRHPYGSLDGLPLSYLKMLHTADHENGRSSAIVSQPTYVRESSAGCPTGGCPPQYSVPSYRVFRR